MMYRPQGKYEEKKNREKENREKESKEGKASYLSKGVRAAGLGVGMVVHWDEIRQLLRADDGMTTRGWWCTAMVRSLSVWLLATGGWDHCVR
jgi:hypothetical protein